MKQFRTKSADMPSRVAALGYLGLIAARLRKEDAGCRENSEVEEVLTQHGFQVGCFKFLNMYVYLWI